jgi:hypothetical protein
VAIKLCHIPSEKPSGSVSGLPEILKASIKAPNINIEIMETNPSHLIIPNGLEDIVFSK